MMNAGCYGKTISDNLIGCNVINRNGKIAYLKKEEINFSYRKVSIDDTPLLQVQTLEKIIVKIKSQKNNENLTVRSSTQPINFRTGGGTFKNPPNQSAWKLIDKINYREKNR